MKSIFVFFLEFREKQVQLASLVFLKAIIHSVLAVDVASCCYLENFIWKERE